MRIYFSLRHLFTILRNDCLCGLYKDIMSKHQNNRNRDLVAFQKCLLFGPPVFLCQGQIYWCLGYAQKLQLMILIKGRNSYHCSLRLWIFGKVPVGHWCFAYRWWCPGGECWGSNICASPSTHHNETGQKYIQVLWLSLHSPAPDKLCLRPGDRHWGADFH